MSSAPESLDTAGIRRVLHEMANGLAGAHQACQLLAHREAAIADEQELAVLSLEGIERALALLRDVQQHVRSNGELPLEH